MANKSGKSQVASVKSQVTRRESHVASRESRVASRMSMSHVACRSRMSQSHVACRTSHVARRTSHVALTMLLWKKVLLEVVLGFSEPTVAVENEAGSICTVIHSNDNLRSQEDVKSAFYPFKACA